MSLLLRKDVGVVAHILRLHLLMCVPLSASGVCALYFDVGLTLDGGG